MRDKWWITVVMLLAVLSASAAGEQDQLQTDSLKADSINRVAAHPDFVKVWLVTVTPGNSTTSVFGHAALRLQCASENLDYCFSFGTEDDGLDFFKFVNGCFSTFSARTNDRISLIEKKYRCYLAIPYPLTVLRKEGLYVLFALADPHTF